VTFPLVTVPAELVESPQLMVAEYVGDPRSVVIDATV
jgi:hypothetical protein